MNADARPVPVADADSAPFWDGCRAGELRLQQCADCGAHRYPPASLCPACGGGETRWAALSGRGTVFSWIVVVHPSPRAVYADEVPYVVALIDLEEGVHMASNIVGCAPEDVTAGMPVEVVFEKVSEEITLPKFRPVEGAPDR
jgi:uncharacterized OB-fold protein